MEVYLRAQQLPVRAATVQSERLLPLENRKHKCRQTWRLDDVISLGGGWRLQCGTQFKLRVDRLWRFTLSPRSQHFGTQPHPLEHVCMPNNVVLRNAWSLGFGVTFIFNSS